MIFSYNVGIKDHAPIVTHISRYKEAVQDLQHCPQNHQYKKASQPLLTSAVNVGLA